MPALAVTERGGLVRLELHGLAHGDGPSLQDAADELIRRLLELARAARAGGFGASCELCPDIDALNFLYELADVAAAGGDIRERLFA